MRDQAFLSKLILTNINQYLVTDNDCELLSLKANQYSLGGVAVGPSSLEKLERYQGDAILGCSIAYPSGAYPWDAKSEEIRIVESRFPFVGQYYAALSVGNYLSGNIGETQTEIREMAAATKKPVRLIVETSCLSDAQLQEICSFANEAGIDGIVTSACFAPYELPQTTPEEVARLKKSGGNLSIIGFISSTDPVDIEKLLQAGADYVMVGDIADFI